jgi:hypothetical protein
MSGGRFPSKGCVKMILRRGGLSLKMLVCARIWR